jgi:high-affinity iron transporter
LRAYGEIIAAVTGILAIGVLLLITNWLFHQVYWRQWVTTLKNQAQGESPWQLVSVGFLVGYREGFETVLFLQSLYLDAGGRSVSIGVAIGLGLLLVLGFAALKIGLKLPYFHILLATAILIGFVLITFVGGTVRAMQTVGWLPVTRLTEGSWPAWMGTWLGLHNTQQSILAQVLICMIVLGTWRVARWKAKRKYNHRAAAGGVEAGVSEGRPAAVAGRTHQPSPLTSAH